MMLFDFTNKKILITGASSGIGRATAIKLSQLGAQIILISRDENKLLETYSFLDGKGHHYYPYDLNNIDGIESLINIIVKTNGALDSFVHSAGVGLVRPLNLSRYDFMLKVMNINFFSFVEISRCITKKGSFNKGMNIVGVSALGAFLGNSSKTAYSASKAAMNAAVRCMAKELSVKGIRVNTVAPGVTNTSMFSEFQQIDINLDESSDILKRQYLGICDPIDVANSIIFLLSNMSKMITGSCITVDGGKLTS